MTAHPVRPDAYDMEGKKTYDHPDTRHFRIWVQGRLDVGFSEGLPGIEQKDVSAGTLLSGVLLDQSHLHGTLDLLRSLGIDVLRFEVDPPHAPSTTDRVEASDEAGRHLYPQESTKRPSVRDGGHDQEKGK